MFNALHNLGCLIYSYHVFEMTTINPTCCRKQDIKHLMLEKALCNITRKKVSHVRLSLRNNRLPSLRLQLAHVVLIIMSKISGCYNPMEFFSVIVNFSFWQMIQDFMTFLYFLEHVTINTHVYTNTAVVVFGGHYNIQ